MRKNRDGISNISKSTFAQMTNNNSLTEMLKFIKSREDFTAKYQPPHINQIYELTMLLYFEEFHKAYFLCDIMSPATINFITVLFVTHLCDYVVQRLFTSSNYYY